MQLSLVTAPTIEPISLSELKLFLRIDSGSFADNIDETQSIVPGAHVIAAGYTLVGTGVEVLGYTPVVILNSGTNGAGGTVDVKIQESDDDATYTDWSTGAFTQVTEANDDAIQEKAYTGTKRYIRTVATVATETCDFSTTVIRLAATSIEDDLLNAIITAAREHVEDITRRAILTQVWDKYLDGFPAENYIKLPFGNLQSNAKATGTITSSGVQVTAADTVTIDTKTYTFVAAPATEGDVDIGADAAATLDNLKAAINHSGTPGTDYYCDRAHPTVEATTNTDTVQTLQALTGGVVGNSIALTKSAVTLTVSAATLTGATTTLIVKYKDSDGLETILDVTTDYLIETNGEGCGRIVLPYGVTWPSFTAYPSNPIVIRFACGWTTAALVPYKIKAAIKLICADLYEVRQEFILGQSVIENRVVQRLLSSSRLWDEF